MTTNLNFCINYLPSLYQSACNEISSTGRNAKAQLNKLHKQVDNLREKYLNLPYLSSCLKESIKTKILPLSTPQDLVKKMKDTKSRKIILNQVFIKTPSALEGIKKEQKYLEQQARVRIGSRFTGYAGIALNVVVPGSSLITTTLLTGAAVLTQEQLVNQLPSADIKAREKSHTRCRTLSTIACFVFTTAFSVFAMPALKKMSGIS